MGRRESGCVVVLGEVIVEGGPLVLGPFVDGVLGTVTFGWAPLCPLWLKAHTDSGNGAFGLVTNLPVFSARDLERMTTESEGVPVVMIRRRDGLRCPAKQ